MQRFHSITPYSIACCLFTLLMALPAIAAPERGDPVGKVVVARGEVTARAADAEPRPLERRSDIHQGETVVTGKDSRGQLRFEDGAVVALDSGSELVIEKYRFDEDDGEDHAVVRLLTGGLRTLSGEVAERDPDNYEVDTPLASIGVRGTDYQLSLDDKQLNVAVWSGSVVVANEAGELPLGENANYRYATVTDQGLPPEGQLEPPAPAGQGDVDAESVETDGDSDEDSQATDETGSSIEETEDETTFEESEALDSSLESDVEEESESIEPWIPDTIDQKTLGASASLVEVGSQGDRVFSTISTPLDPEQAQYVGAAPDGMFISLEGAGLERFAEDVGGYGINWGAWNGEPDLLVHEDEFDEEGEPLEPLENPLFLASAPASSLTEIQDVRGTGGEVELSSFVDAIGQMQDATAPFNGQETVSFSDPDVDLSNSSFGLDLETGEMFGTIDIRGAGGDVRWQAALGGQLDGEAAMFDVSELDYNGIGQPLPEEGPHGLIVIDDADGTLGFLGNFHFENGDGNASTSGMLLLEEP